MPSLIAVLGLNIRPFEQSLNDSKLMANRAGREMKEAFGNVIADKLPFLSVAGTVVAMGALAESVIETAKRTHELSNEFRVSTDMIQIWEKGAHRAGMTAEDIGNAFNKLKKAREEAIGGGASSTKFEEAFGSFGISMAELKNAAMTTEQIMDRMRAVASSHPLTDQEDVAGMELMGRSGAKIMSAMQQIQNLGPVKIIEHEDIENLMAADRKLQELKDRMKVSAVKPISFGADVLTGVVDFGRALKGMAEGFAKGFDVTKPDQFGLATSWREMKAGWNKIHDEEMDAKSPRYSKEEFDFNYGGGGKGDEYHATKVVNLHKDLAETEKLRQQLAEKILQNQLRAMSATEREAELKRQIAEHERKAIEFEFGEGDDKKALEEKLEAERLRGELSVKKEKTRSHFNSPEVNAMQRIGAYASPAETSMLSEVQKHGQHLAKIEQHLAHMDKTQSFTKY